MVVHAGIITLFHGSAFAQGKEFFNYRESFIQNLNIRERAEILAPVFYNVPGTENPGKVPKGDADNRVGFAVFKVDVVPWAVLLYQGVFKKQRLVFVGDNDGLDSFTVADQGGGFNILGA